MYFEDAGCNNPCGGEPMSCVTCPDKGRTTVRKTNTCSKCGKDPGYTIKHAICDECWERDDEEEDY